MSKQTGTNRLIEHLRQQGSVTLTEKMASDIADLLASIPKVKRPYDYGGSLAEYGIIPECDVAPEPITFRLPARRNTPMRADEGTGPLDFDRGWNQCLEAVQKVISQPPAVGEAAVNDVLEAIDWQSPWTPEQIVFYPRAASAALNKLLAQSAARVNVL